MDSLVLTIAQVMALVMYEPGPAPGPAPAPAAPQGNPQCTFLRNMESGQDEEALCDSDPARVAEAGPSVREESRIS